MYVMCNREKYRGFFFFKYLHVSYDLAKLIRASNLSVLFCFSSIDNHGLCR